MQMCICFVVVEPAVAAAAAPWDSPQQRRSVSRAGAGACLCLIRLFSVQYSSRDKVQSLALTSEPKGHEGAHMAQPE